MRLGAGTAVVALAAALTLFAGPAQAGSMKVFGVTPVSGPTPFSNCPFDAPPPFSPESFQPKDTAVEPHIVVDPKRPNRMAAAWMQDFTGGIVVAYSHNGGRTWHRSIPQKLSQCNGANGTAADPRMAFGADGTLYLSSMRNLQLKAARTVPDNEVAVSASSDGGRTWRDPVVVEEANSYNDYPFIAADPDDPQRVHVTFTKATEPVGNGLFTMFATSEDGGRTFSEPRIIFRSTEAAVYYSSGQLLAQRNGRLLLVLWVYDGVNYFGTPYQTMSKITALASADRGATWADPVVVGEQFPEDDAVDPETGEDFQTGGVHVATARDGGWWISWHDADGTRARLNLVRGRADGTWEAPREVLPWAERQIFYPMVAQTPEGSVGLLWYDTRSDRPDDGKFLADAFFAVSRDEGRTFKSLHVAGPMDLRLGWADARTFSGMGARFLGDYAGFASRPKGFVAALPMTAPVAKVGMSQLFVADIHEQPATKKKKKAKKKKAKKKKKRKKRR
jgi:hypothetical protein